MEKINVLDKEVAIYGQGLHEFYLVGTDIARYKNADNTDDLVRNWIRNWNTIEFPGIWEQLNNPDFNPIEFDGIRKQAGLNSFTLTPRQWIEKTRAWGIVSKPGRYGGTFAHKDIAFEFASWISVEFKLYLIKEFQHLKEDERKHKNSYISIRIDNTVMVNPSLLHRVQRDLISGVGPLSSRTPEIQGSLRYT